MDLFCRLQKKIFPQKTSQIKTTIFVKLKLMDQQI